MAFNIYAGWDFASIGSFTMTTTGVSESITISSGTYCHVDLQSVMGTGSYDDFETALQTALNAVAPTGWTVTFDTNSYTIANSSSFQITALSTVAQRILGITTLPTASATSTASQVRPGYLIQPAVGGRSNVSDDYEPDGIASDGESDSGQSFGICRTTAPKWHDFDVPMETKEASFSRSALTAVPWTYQHLFEHCRNVEPIALDMDSDDTVIKLRDQGAVWKPQRVLADHDGLWTIPFKARLVGRLTVDTTP